MGIFFFDSSAIVKRYVTETGSDYVESLVNLESGNSIFISRITPVEVASAFARRLRSRSLSRSDAENAMSLFQKDLTNNYFIVEMTADLLSGAVELASKYALRGYDAVQLSTSLEVDKQMRISKEAVNFVSADSELLAVAEAAGLVAINPNQHGG